MHIAFVCHLELYTDSGGNNYLIPGEFLSFLAYKKCLYFYASFILMERDRGRQYGGRILAVI